MTSNTVADRRRSLSASALGDRRRGATAQKDETTLHTESIDIESDPILCDLREAAKTAVAQTRDTNWNDYGMVLVDPGNRKMVDHVLAQGGVDVAGRVFQIVSLDNFRRVGAPVSNGYAHALLISADKAVVVTLERTS